MSSLTVRDALATVVTAAVLVPFIGYSVRGSMPFVQDPRGMAAVGVLGVLLVALAFGSRPFHAPITGGLMWILAVVGLAFGIGALIVETSWTLLVPMIAALAGLWLVGIVQDAGFLTRPPTVRHG